MSEICKGPAMSGRAITFLGILKLIGLIISKSGFKFPPHHLAVNY